MSKQYEEEETTSDEASLSLEQLIAQQGVSSVEDLDEILALWPADDDPDILTQYILQDRHMRTQIMSRLDSYYGI